MTLKLGLPLRRVPSASPTVISSGIITFSCALRAFFPAGGRRRSNSVSRFVLLELLAAGAGRAGCTSACCPAGWACGGSRRSWWKPDRLAGIEGSTFTSTVRVSTVTWLSSRRTETGLSWGNRRPGTERGPARSGRHSLPRLCRCSSLAVLIVVIVCLGSLCLAQAGLCLGFFMFFGSAFFLRRLAFFSCFFSGFGQAAFALFRYSSRLATLLSLLFLQQFVLCFQVELFCWCRPWRPAHPGPQKHLNLQNRSLYILRHRRLPILIAPQSERRSKPELYKLWSVIGVNSHRFAADIGQGGPGSWHGDHVHQVTPASEVQAP